VFLTLVVLALPQRRVLDPDPDDDGDFVFFSEGVKSSEAS
jgi:hypothetical protein